MGYNDHLPDDEFNQFLKELLNGNDLKEDIEEVIRKFLSEGHDALSKKEQLTFKKIQDEYSEIRCKICGCEIPFSELYLALDTHICSACDKRFQSD